MVSVRSIPNYYSLRETLDCLANRHDARAIADAFIRCYDHGIGLRQSRCDRHLIVVHQTGLDVFWLQQHFVGRVGHQALFTLHVSK